MEFRPCIDIHNGSVKQIVGGSLSDKDNHAEDNFVSLNDAGFYAQMYKNDGLKGGHIIILNSAQSEYYEKDIEQAKAQGGCADHIEKNFFVIHILNSLSC